MPYHSVEANDGSKPNTAKDTQNVVHRENSRLNSGLISHVSDDSSFDTAGPYL